MAHAHGHQHDRSVKVLRTAFVLNSTFTIVELVGSTWTGSVAVLADAVHDLGDCLVLGAAWYLQRLSRRGRDADYTFGYARFSMLGGWLAALVLIAGAVWTVSMAIPRFSASVMPDTQGMIGLAVLGLVVNAIAARGLHGGLSLNERGAFLHLLEDVLGWAAVLIGALVMQFTHRSWIDPLLSIAIALFIVINAIGTLRRGTHILMLRKPGDLDLDGLTTRLKGIPHVVDVHDRHAWTLDGNYTILTLHLVLDDLDPEIASSVKLQARDLMGSVGIAHATIELESVGEECLLEHH
ncbi:MAG: cation transporter [Flavobacteriales bacterium]|nr:cation transporter [Flavobacteriales bacterium]